LLYVYASLLLYSAGKEINEENLKKVVEATGTEPDLAQIKAIVSSLKGVNIEEVIKKGLASAPQPQAQQPAQTEAKPKEEKKEEEKKEEEEISAEGLGALFG